MIVTVSIHAPREGSDEPVIRFACAQAVSIHAPREGSDRRGDRAQGKRSLFQSTLPVKGATRWIAGDSFYISVSIHAPREGSDLKIKDDNSSTPCFNPRSP